MLLRFITIMMIVCISGPRSSLQVAALYEKTLKAATPAEVQHLKAGEAKEASWEAKHHHVPTPAP